jgi:RNAse (barnase) inhibitor barstar
MDRTFKILAGKAISQGFNDYDEEQDFFFKETFKFSKKPNKILDNLWQEVRRIKFTQAE